MADRTSAEVFGIIFEMLAENPTKENKALAKRIYQLTRNYDFNAYQMDVDEAGIILELAEKYVNSKYPEDGPVVRWTAFE